MVLEYKVDRKPVNIVFVDRVLYTLSTNVEKDYILVIFTKNGLGTCEIFVDKISAYVNEKSLYEFLETIIEEIPERNLRFTIDGLNADYRSAMYYLVGQAMNI